MEKSADFLFILGEEFFSTLAMKTRTILHRILDRGEGEVLHLSISDPSGYIILEISKKVQAFGTICIAFLLES